ncbi:MAG: type II secretion system F family protein [Haloarculaceae archaeon]
MSGNEHEFAPSQHGIAGPAHREPTEDELLRLREEYGYIRTFFKTRPDEHRDVQRWLNQARMGILYDEYLTRSLKYSLLAGAVGAVLGALLTVGLVEWGILAGLESPLSFSTSVTRYIGANRTLFAALFLVVGLGGGLALLAWVIQYYYPLTVVSTRRQAITIGLPNAIVFMYALSKGGMNLLEIMRVLADSEGTYGEVAREFEMVINDIELFGSDVYTALLNARNLTPSDNFEQFLDDMVSVLDSGGDITIFLEEEAETYLREARDEQESFLETISLLAEVFVVGFVAAPLFLIVTLVVISLIGGNTVTQVSGLIYLIMPIGMVAFMFLVDLLSQPYEVAQSGELETLDEVTVDTGALTDDERFETYDRTARKLALLDHVRDPLESVRHEPLYSLVVTVPVALVVAAVFAVTGTPPTLAAMKAQPIGTTTAFVVLPFFIVSVPLSLFYEMKRSRENEITKRFPDTLNILSSANRMGIQLTDALELVSRWASGPVAVELRTVKNDIDWNNDTTAALLRFGNRLRVPQLSRTMKLLAEGIRSSGDLSDVLSIAAEDARNRHKLDRDRRRELSSYIAVVVIGFLVYLLVILLLDTSYLAPLKTVGGQTPADPGAPDLPLSFASVPIETYQLVFFHSALIQAVGSGLLAGKLSDNRILSGLKYSIALTALAVAAFAFI